jgi:hypothetical protein
MIERTAMKKSATQTDARADKPADPALRAFPDGATEGVETVPELLPGDAYATSLLLEGGGGDRRREAEAALTRRRRLAVVRASRRGTGIMRTEFQWQWRPKRPTLLDVGHGWGHLEVTGRRRGTVKSRAL